MNQKPYCKKHFQQIMRKMLTLLLSLIFIGAVYAQERTVSGSITDKSNAPLPGVNIVIKGTTTGTVTDLNGKFSVKVPDNNAVLVITYVGYDKQEIQVGTQTSIGVQLKENVQQLNEVVVVGYGVQKKSDLTGAVASVSGDKLKEMPVAGVDQALQGRAAGVNIISNTGMPGGTSSVQIRGISSINGTAPLVIVDGMPSSLDYITHDLNPGDIESLEVLKDASSAAIYGASGGNGVILVSTKKGKAGKTVTTFNYYRGWQTPWKKLDMCNSQQYVEIQNNLAAVKYANNGKFTKPLKLFSTKPDTFPNYNWQDIMFRTAMMENYDFSISGGNEKSTFMVSSNYLTQYGILKPSDFTRFTTRINSDHQLSSKIKFGENANFAYTKTNGYTEGQYSSEYVNNNQGILTGILTMYPYISPYDSSGNWSISPNGGSNPKVAEDTKNRQEYQYNTGGNVYIDLNLFKGFTFTSRLGSYINFGVKDEFTPVFHYSTTYYNANNSIYKMMNEGFGWTFQNFATYSTSLFTDHNISLMAGMESGYDKYIEMFGTRLDLINETPEMRYFDASQDNTSTLQFVQGGRNDHESSSYAYFGRFNYDYKGRYLATFNYRNDNSSRFGPGKRSGKFPSYSFGWKFSEEGFMKDQNIISFGKIRYGWGSTGANAPDYYAYYASVVPNQKALTYDFDHATITNGSAIVQVPNRDIHWETMVMNDLGIDLGFLNNKVNFTGDYFIRHNNGMLVHQDLAALSGTYQLQADQYQLGGDARPLVNAGNMENKGFEFSIGYKKMEGELKTSIDFNITYSTNKYSGNDTITYGNVGVNLTPITITESGHPIAQFYGYKTNGIFRDTNDVKNYAKNGKLIQPGAKPGDFKFVDVNGDGKISPLDKTLIGNPFPKFAFGFSCNFEYKGFDLSLFFQGSSGNKIFNGQKSNLMTQDIGGNYLTDELNQYRAPIYDNNGNLIYAGHTNTNLPRLDPKGSNGNFSRVSDFYVEDGSYIRLKNLQFGYTVPKQFSNKFGVETFRVYVGFKNLLTLTKYSGFDPEIGANVISGSQGELLFGTDKAGNYPQPFMFQVGANLQF